METGRIIDAFAALGGRLAAFGGDAATHDVLRRAAEVNPWFTEKDIVTAAGILAGTMLRRDVLTRWLGGRCAAEPALRVGIVMAGNIPFVGFSDLLCVAAAGHTPCVKPSSKDAVLMEYVFGQLRALAPGLAIERLEDYAPDALIVSGSDNTGRHFRAAYGGIPMIVRGSRSSAAVLDGSETAAELAALACDMFLYSGLGCRNVSLLLVPRDTDLVSLGRSLAEARGGVNPKYANNCRAVRARLAVEGAPFVDCGSFLMVEGADFPADLSVVTAVRCGSPVEAEEWLRAHEGRLQCVVGRTVHPRGVPFGMAQRPAPWDYPDGEDVLAFLDSAAAARRA